MQFRLIFSSLSCKLLAETEDIKDIVNDSFPTRQRNRFNKQETSQALFESAKLLVCMEPLRIPGPPWLVLLSIHTFPGGGKKGPGISGEGGLGGDAETPRSYLTVLPAG